MADLADVEQGLVNAISTALYPSGPSSSSIVGSDVRIARGWPVSDELNADLAAGIANVTIYSEPGATRNSTRYLEGWKEYQPATVSLTATISGSAVTFSGAGLAQQLVGLRVDGIPYVYPATVTDTPNTVVTALAALIPGATAVGAILTLAGTPHIVARIQGFALVGKEKRRQWQRIRVSGWCCTVAQRDAVVGAVDNALADYDGLFLPLPDGTSGLLMYRGTYPNDVPAKDNLWRRDLIYEIEYATVTFASAPPLLWPDITMTVHDGLSSIVHDITP